MRIVCKDAIDVRLLEYDGIPHIRQTEATIYRCTLLPEVKQQQQKMEDTREGRTDDCREYISLEVSVKQEPLDEDFNYDVKYPDLQNQTNEPHVHSFPLGICVKQELRTACIIEAHIVSTTVKTEDVTDSTPLDDVVQAGSAGSLCKVETEPTVQNICISKVENVKTNVPADETPFPVALYGHQRAHSSIETTSYEYNQGKFLHEKETHQCSTFDYTSVNKRNSQGSVAFLCPTCGKSFQTRSGYRRHVRNHDEKRMFTCPHCQREFVERNHFLGHVNSHEGEKPHRCCACGKTYSYGASLARHLRRCTGGSGKTDGTEPRHLQCQDCTRKFARKDVLEEHRRAKHSRLLNYRCPVEECRVAYRWRSSLAKHVKTHSRDGI